MCSGLTWALGGQQQARGRDSGHLDAGSVLTVMTGMEQEGVHLAYGKGKWPDHMRREP